MSAESELMRSWADLARLVPKGAPPSWAPVSGMIKAAESHAQELEAELVRLLEKSNQSFEPLSDPLYADAGLNRWLKSEREEAYSDWLAWILQQIRQPDQILSLIQINDLDFARCCQHEVVDIHREQVIPAGRLDVVLQFGTAALVVIEVKTSSECIAGSGRRRARVAVFYRPCPAKNSRVCGGKRRGLLPNSASGARKRMPALAVPAAAIDGRSDYEDFLQRKIDRLVAQIEAHPAVAWLPGARRTWNGV